MPQALPFAPSNANYEFTTVLNDEPYRFVVHWNEYEGYWYFDILDGSGKTLECDVKIVIGTYLGRTSNHKLFKDGVFTVIDTSGGYRDAGFDDMGTRVQVWYYAISDIIHAVYGT